MKILKVRKVDASLFDKKAFDAFEKAIDNNLDNVVDLFQKIKKFTPNKPGYKDELDSIWTGIYRLQNQCNDLKAVLSEARNRIESFCQDIEAFNKFSKRKP